MKKAIKEKEAERNERIDKDYPLEHVPKDVNQGFWSICFLFLGFTFFTPTMSSGATVGLAFTFDKLLFILACGSVLLGLYVAVLAAMGARTRISSAMQAKYTYGEIGVKISDILLGGTQVFWFAITAEYMGELFAYGLGLDTQFWKIFFILLFSIGMGVTALNGVKGMALISYIAIPAMALLLIISIYLAVKEAGSFSAIRAIIPTEEMSTASAITIIVGTFASGGTTIANYSRFCRKSSHAFIAGIVAFTLGNGAVIFVGMLGGLVFNSGDIISLMLTMGLILWALIILTLNIWTTNTASAYAFGVAGAEFFNKNNKTPFIVGGIIIAIVLAISGISNYFTSILNFLGVFVPPLGGAMIGDYFLISKGKIPMLPYVTFKKLRIAPLIAFILGCVAAYGTAAVSIGIPPMQGIIVSIISVPIVNAILSKAGLCDYHEVRENAKYM